jgi:hypothetical protein
MADKAKHFQAVSLIRRIHCIIPRCRLGNKSVCVNELSSIRVDKKSENHATSTIKLFARHPENCE